MEYIKMRGGIVRAKDAAKEGICRQDLYSLRDKGLLRQRGRGVFQLEGGSYLVDKTILAVVALHYPHAVVCLKSALRFHGMTNEMTWDVSIAVQRGTHAPALKFPKVEAHRFSGASFTEGIETHLINGVPVRVYSPEKTIVDCFRLMDRKGSGIYPGIALEAFKMYIERGDPKISDICVHAKRMRTWDKISPYVQMATHGMG
jgi:predicted transcriptional regulator of viral defense system